MGSALRLTTFPALSPPVPGEHSPYDATMPADDASAVDDTSATDVPRYASRDQLRALAHPLRLEIMTRVGRRGVARAADIAQDLDLPANSVSYHLRILARGGVIVEAPEAARDRRDRVWKLAQHSFMHSADVLDDPQSRDEHYIAASAAVSVASLDWFRSRWLRHLGHLDESATGEIIPQATERPVGTMQASDLRISRAQAQELIGVVSSALQEMAQKNRDASGVDLPDTPDSEEEVLDFRVLFALIEDVP